MTNDHNNSLEKIIYVYPTLAANCQETELRVTKALWYYYNLKNVHNSNIEFLVHPDTPKVCSSIDKILKDAHYKTLNTYPTSSIEEIEALKEYGEKYSNSSYEFRIFTSDYHVPKWKILTRYYRLPSKIYSVDVSNSKMEKYKKALLHIFHAILGIFNRSLYHKIRKLV